MLEDILREMPSLAKASIQQSSKPRFGVMTTDFHALIGRKLTPLFTLQFKDTADAMFIEKLTPAEGCPLSADDLDKICQVAIRP